VDKVAYLPTRVNLVIPRRVSAKYHRIAQADKAIDILAIKYRENCFDNFIYNSCGCVVDHVGTENFKIFAIS